MDKKIIDSCERKSWKIIGLLFIFGFVFSLNFILAESAINYCCEKTLSGAWCQNAPLAECSSAFKTSPTSCDSTSYCKRGCCFDSQEGICMQSTPQKVCADSGGTWADDSKCKIPQCNLGCCIIGEEGAFVTLTRCKELSGTYGIKTDFRANIQDEVVCITTAQGQDKGACVTEDPATLAKNCVFTTRATCKVGNTDGEVINVSGNATKIASVGFYKDVLCSAEDLGSICGPSKITTLIPGQDRIYYLDSCGNIANIYDANKYDDKDYWKKIYSNSESCGSGTSNAGSKTCGNCDYYLGSIGKKSTSTLGGPVYGDYICADLSCKDIGKQHGESWCVKDSPSGEGLDTVGSRYFKQICLYDEIITEPCADYRNEVCLEGTFNGFTEAACRVNRWQDCISQVEQFDCENKDVRDCLWIDDYYYSANSNQIEKSNNDSKKGAITPTGLCVPFYPPGNNFWGTNPTSKTSTTGKSTNGTAATFSANTPAFSASTTGFGTGYVNPASASVSDVCSYGNAKLTFKWEKVKRMWPFNDEAWECANDECKKYDKDPSKSEITEEEAQAWTEDMNEICYKLGDCGGYTNWKGVYTEDGYAAYLDYKRIAGAGGAEIQEQPEATPKATGNVVKGIINSMFGK